MLWRGCDALRITTGATGAARVGRLGVTFDNGVGAGVGSGCSNSAVYGSSSSTLGYVILTGDALDPCLLRQSASASGDNGGDEGGVIKLWCAESVRPASLYEVGVLKAWL